MANTTEQLTADELAAKAKLEAQQAVNPIAATGQKYDPLAYLQQQLEQYAQQFKPQVEKLNIETAKEREKIASQSEAMKKNEEALKQQDAIVKTTKNTYDQTQKAYKEAEAQHINAKNNYAAIVQQKNNAINSTRNSILQKLGNQKILVGGKYKTILEVFGSDPNKWFPSYKNKFNSEYNKAVSALNFVYYPKLVQASSQLTQASAKYQDATRRYTNATAQYHQAQQQHKNLQTAVTNLKKGIESGSATIAEQQKAQEEIDRQIESFKAAEGPKTELGASIAGTKEQAIQSAKEAAKNIAASQSDVDKSNLQNLLNDQADKIAKTFGLNPDEVKNQLQASEAFKAAGTQMPTQMTPEQFKNYMGQAIAQQGPQLQAKKLEAGQITGGTEESRQRLAEYEADAQQQAQASNLAREQTQRAYEQAEQQRQQAVEQAKQAAQQRFAQQQKEYFTTDAAQGGQFHQMEGGGEATSGFQQTLPQQQFTQQPVQQIPVGKIGQFDSALQNAIKSQAAKGFQGALNTVRPDQLRPTQPPLQQPQMIGNVQRGLTPQPQQRAGLPPTSPAQAGNQTRMPGQQKGAPPVSSPTPNQQVTFGNRYQPPISKTSPAQQQTQQAIQQRQRQINQQIKATGSEAQKQAMGLAKTPTSVMAGYKQKINPYDKGQNIQMGAKELNVNREAGMRMPR